MNILIDGQTLETPEINRGIGVYFKNVLNNMIKQSFEHNWFITVSNQQCLKALDPWVTQNINPIINSIFKPTTDYSNKLEYTDRLCECVEKFQIDAYWNANPLMVNVLFPTKNIGCKMFITIHDLIPAVLPVKDWSNNVKEEYWERIQKNIKECQCNLVCVSSASQIDANKYIGEDVASKVIMEAADSRKFYRKKFLDNTDNKTPQIMFTGGFDYRKNLMGAVEALKEAKRKYPDDILVQKSILSIVCDVDDNQKKEFYDYVKKSGLGGKIKLTGFINDEELSRMYNTCDVFFFPSLYEGFGLPILEAMLGGAYVLSADNSSLPEVCGEMALLCDAKDKIDMAFKIKEALHESRNEKLEDKYRRQQYALSYSWENTALKMLDNFKDDSNNVQVIKRKIAIVTPWPKQKSGIANYVYRLVPYLAKYFDIDIYVDNFWVNNCQFVEFKQGNLFKIDELDSRINKYEKIIYQIGNSKEHHTKTYKALLKFGGIAEIHDFVLHPFFYHAYFLTKEINVYKEALQNGYGRQGYKHFLDVKDKIAYPDNSKFPMAESLINISQAVIFHNHWSCNQITSHKVNVIPHPCFEPDEIDSVLYKKIKQDFLAGFNITNGDVIVGCFGFINENKRPFVVINAVKVLVEKGLDLKLIFWGENNVAELEEYILNIGLQKNIHISGYLNNDEYQVALRMTDIVVNLRFPSMGESSGTLCESFKIGKPVIVSDVNQYQEFPDEICWKVPVGGLENANLIDMIEYLILDDCVREALGKNAKEYANFVLDPEKIAKMYYDLLKGEEKEQ